MVQGLGRGFRSRGLGFRGLGFRGLGFRGLGFRGLVFRFQGLGLGNNPGYSQVRSYSLSSLLF